ncbi:WGR domain-containing protein [uncultured Phenylobacterium sp.]|uniref:WGR domain-containing protein n=1 Tax=uncultured Phenylobacterium sp. TaxID=349273 RepID=UPI0025F79C3B|nr:WGR domain-containing protein [uncultured Phenylobacterium sp.]
MIVLRRIDNSCNMARFYALSIERSLFGESILIRRWGRIGTHGQRREDWYRASDDAAAALGRLVGRKVRRGYLLVGGAAPALTASR